MAGVDIGNSSPWLLGMIIGGDGVVDSFVTLLCASDDALLTE